VKDCDDLVSKTKKMGCIPFCEYITPEEFVERYFCQNSSCEFEISDTKYKDKKYVLSTTAMLGDDPETFSMKIDLLNRGKEEKGSCQMPRLHLSLQCRGNFADSDDSEIIPISWCGKPTCDRSKTYWNWGCLTFHEKDLKDLDMMGWCANGLLDTKYSYQMFDSEDIGRILRYRLIAYLLD
jgi:hypothetical protein